MFSIICYWFIFLSYLYRILRRLKREFWIFEWNLIDFLEHVTAMGPLIDAALEKVDRRHAQLTQLSSDLVDALNLYHTLMRDPPHQSPASYTLPKMPPVHGYPYPNQGQPPLPSVSRRNVLNFNFLLRYLAKREVWENTNWYNFFFDFHE